MRPCNTVQYNTLPLSGNKSVHCHQSPHQPPALLLLSFSCDAAPAASHCQGAESPPNRNGGIMGKWCSIDAGAWFKYFTRNIGWTKYWMKEILHERHIRWPKEFWVQSEWFNNNNYYEIKSLQNVRMSLPTAKSKNYSDAEPLGEEELEEFYVFGDGFLNISKLWEWVHLCEIQAPAGWLRWWQIQSVEIHRSPSELPLNTPPPEYNGIHKSKQIQKYKSTAKAFSKAHQIHLHKITNWKAQLKSFTNGITRRQKNL